MDTLDNNNVPNNLTTGNHDVNTTNGNGTFFDQYFPPSRYTGFSWYGGYLGQLVSDPVNRMNKNNYELFSAGGIDFVILHLELDIPDYALNWADGILDQYSDRMAIITTHLVRGHDEHASDDLPVPHEWQFGRSDLAAPYQAQLQRVHGPQRPLPGRGPSYRPERLRQARSPACSPTTRTAPTAATAGCDE